MRLVQLMPRELELAGKGIIQNDHGRSHVLQALYNGSPYEAFWKARG